MLKYLNQLIELKASVLVDQEVKMAVIELKRVSSTMEGQDKILN